VAIQVPAPCELTLGMVCIDKATPGHTVWRMVADERFANPAGTIQGGFLSAFADSAMGSATVTWARAAERKVYTANAEMKISFMKAVRVGSVLTCKASVLSGGRRALFAEASVVDDSDSLIARASSTYILTPRE
jgi:uncharacterized protein (TIGR00369 family)